MTVPRDLDLHVKGRVRLAYRDWDGSGQPLVLLHGLASSYRIWDFVAPILAERFRIVAIDQRGHGRSDRPDGSLDFGTFVGDLRAVIDALELGPSIVVGHSWGGNVALQLAVDEPELVQGLVLVDGGFLELSARPGWSWERVEQELAPPPLDGLTADELLVRASQGDLASIWSPAVAESLLGHFEHLGDGRIRPWLRREHHMRILRAMWEHRPSQLWSRVQCPVLMIPARRADLSGRQAEFQAGKQASVAQAERLLANGQTLWMDDTIHDIPIHRPSELAAAIARFGASLSRSTTPRA